MNMQCELNLYSTFLKKVLFQQLRFIPVLLTADKIQSKYPAAAREGMKPSPTVTECCYRVDNSLITKVLHISAVGAGFIPALPTTSKN